MKKCKLLFPFAAWLLLFSVLPSSCGNSKSETLDQGEVEDRIQNAFVDLSGMKMSFTDRDLDPSYNKSEATRIHFGSAVTVEGDGARADGKTVTITEAGTYLLSGEADGSITVSLEKEDKAQLIFDGLTLTCDHGPALRILSGNKVFLTLAKGSTNELSDGASYELTENGSTLDGAIFSKTDLCINGDGALTVTGAPPLPPLK